MQLFVVCPQYKKMFHFSINLSLVLKIVLSQSVSLALLIRVDSKMHVLTLPIFIYNMLHTCSLFDIHFCLCFGFPTCLVKQLSNTGIYQNY